MKRRTAERPTLLALAREQLAHHGARRWVEAVEPVRVRVPVAGPLRLLLTLDQTGREAFAVYGDDGNPFASPRGVVGHVVDDDGKRYEERRATVARIDERRTTT